MRTIEELLAELVAATADDSDRGGSEDNANRDGCIDGFYAALRMIGNGRTSAEILNAAQADEAAYVAHGNDDQDAWQNGYLMALYWAAEQFDWDAEGVPLFRDGNVWGLAPDGREPNEAAARTGK